MAKNKKGAKGAKHKADVDGTGCPAQRATRQRHARSAARTTKHSCTCCRSNW
jgi:hypothetical protein